MKDLVLRYYEAVDNNDVAALLDLFEPDAVYERPGYDPLVGRAALEAFYTGVRLIESGRHGITQLVCSDGKVAVQGTFEGRLRDASEVSLRFSDFFEEGTSGRFARRTTYFFAKMV